MGVVTASTVLSHWNHLVPNVQQSSQEFYGSIDRYLKDAQLDGVKIERVNFHEGGMLSARREYLQVRRKDYVFHICAAPFGSGFFVSWWLGEVHSGLWGMLARIPFVGGLFDFLEARLKPLTYYRIDTALMFQSATHGAVLGVLDEVMSTSGKRLTDIEKKPVMRDLFRQIAGGGGK